MPDDYTPTDAEVREKYATPWHETVDFTIETEMADFDRWLAAHDAELIEKLAGKLAHPEHAPYEVWASGAGDWLRGQARQMRHPRHTTESDADRTREEQDQ